MHGHGRSCGPHEHGWARWARAGHHHGGGGGHGGGIGVRRPLRFLAHRLDMTQEQVEQAAAILDTLKIERAQHEVDDRRARSAFADAVVGDASGAFDAAKARQAAADRVKSVERVNAAVTTALEQLVGILEPDQRRQLALLLRTGVLEV